MAVSKRLRYEVLKRDNFTCRDCGRTPPEVKLQTDHVIPVTLGGSDDPSNLATRCADCNAGKSSSSPDAPQVAAVAKDAERWSLAMQAAADAMLGELGTLSDEQDRFKRTWARFGSGPDRQPLPKDLNWRDTVDKLIAAGLPFEVLEDCVRIAMSKRMVAEEDVFRYMCGIAWNKVTELQTRARSAMDTPAGETGAPFDEDLPWVHQARRDMACELLGDLTEQEREISLDDMRGIFGADDPNVEISAAFAEFHGAVRERRQMVMLLDYFLSTHPDGDFFLNEAQEHLEKVVGSFSRADLIRVAALKLTGYGQRAGVVV